MAAADPERALLATLVWSAKESALKAVRTGLERDTRSMEVRFPSDPKLNGECWDAFTARCAETGRDFYGWLKREGERVFTLACAVKTNSPSPLP